MLTVHQITKSFGIHAVLQDISFSLSTGEHVGLIGPNGSGKTTLMRILAGLEAPDTGSVAHTYPGLQIGYLAQGMQFAPGQTIESSLGLASVSTDALEAEIASLAAAISKNPRDSALQGKYDLTLAQLSTALRPPSTILIPLGLADIDLQTPVANLSGGQKTRLMLAQVLLKEPNLLLLDEPTNHLDISMLEWLEDWIKSYPGAALVVSHDRAFLDNTINTINTILELDPATHCLKQYAGNYSDYTEQKEAERERQFQTYQDQQAEIRRMQADIARTRAQAERTEREASSIRIGGPDYKMKGYKSYQQGIAKKVAKKSKAREKKLERFLDSDALVERPRPSWQIKLDFGAPAHQSKDVLLTDNLSVGYPGGAALLSGLNLAVRNGQRIALTGPNGAGKTTLLRTIAGKLTPLAGSLRLGASVKLGYMTQEQELLDPALSPLRTIQRAAAFNETEARHFLHFFLFSGDDPLRPSAEMSYGERARLQLAVLIAQGCTFLLLDEPINHLDIPSRARFEQALANFKGTVLAVVHDRYFIEHFAEDVWIVQDGQLQKW